MAAAQVDDAQRVVRAQIGRGLDDCFPGPPIGVVHQSARQVLGSPIVEVHREDRVFGDRPGPLPTQVLRRQKVDGQPAAPGHRAASVDHALIDHALSEHEVDVPAGQIDIAFARPVRVRHHALELHGDDQFPGERGRHDDQGEAVAAASLERLGRVAGHSGVVVELQRAARVEGLDQPVGAAPGRDLGGDMVAEVAPHRRAERKHGLNIDRRGGRREVVVREDRCGRVLADRVRTGPQQGRGRDTQVTSHAPSPKEGPRDACFGRTGPAGTTGQATDAKFTPSEGSKRVPAPSSMRRDRPACLPAAPDPPLSRPGRPAPSLQAPAIARGRQEKRRGPKSAP